MSVGVPVSVSGVEVKAKTNDNKKNIRDGGGGGGPNGRFPNGFRGDLMTLMLRFLFVAEFMVERVERVDLRCGASTFVAKGRMADLLTVV